MTSFIEKIIELAKTEDEIIFDYAQKLDMVLVTQDIGFSDLNYLAC
jgi:predicted nuclease of predicted toxin-antitoxin system